LRGLAGKLNLQIELNRPARRRDGRLGQLGTNTDKRKLGAARGLQHMQIAIAVAGIERLDGHRDQKVALSGVARALASRRVADAVNLVERVRDVIREGIFFENPLLGRRAAGRGCDRK
jgi:hypothetical protein